jgi:hypothetical protein
MDGRQIFKDAASVAPKAGIETSLITQALPAGSLT